MQIELCTSGINAVWARGNSPSFVAERLGMDSPTAYCCRDVSPHGRADGLLENRHKGYRGVLDCKQLLPFHKELEQHIHADAKSVPKWICQGFGARYTVQGTIGSLSRTGFTYKKAAGVPCKADISRREDFFGRIGYYKEELETLLIFDFRLINSQTISV